MVKQKQQTSEEISQLLEGLPKLRFNLTAVANEQRPWQHIAQTHIKQYWEKSTGNDWEHH